MLTPPELPNAVIVKCLSDAYGLHISKIEFLPIGSDVNTAVFRVTSSDGAPYFLKLRHGNFDEAAVAVPAVLHHELGISSVMAPLPTVDQRLWMRIQGYAGMLYPFIDGVSRFERALSDDQWIALGAALGAVHAAILPRELRAHVPCEDFAPDGETM